MILVLSGCAHGNSGPISIHAEYHTADRNMWSALNKCSSETGFEPRNCIISLRYDDKILAASCRENATNGRFVLYPVCAGIGSPLIQGDNKTGLHVSSELLCHYVILTVGFMDAERGGLWIPDNMDYSLMQCGLDLASHVYPVHVDVRLSPASN
jgi:hypothetical protein